MAEKGEDAQLAGIVVAAALTFVMLPLSVNWLLKLKAKLTGAKPGQPHYRSLIWLLVYTVIIIAGWWLVMYAGGSAGGAQHFDPYEVRESRGKGSGDHATRGISPRWCAISFGGG